MKTFYDNLPPKEDLEVREILLGSHILRASSVYLGKYCDDLCKEFILCKDENQAPQACLDEGKAVTACGIEFFEKVKASCRQELEVLTDCIKWTSPTLTPERCREQQAIFDACMFRKMGMERPPFGYFAQNRIHDSPRPRPPEYTPEFPRPSGNIPNDLPVRQKPVTGTTRRNFIDT